MRHYNIANFVLFQVGWFACALGAGNRLEWISVTVLATILGIHMCLSRERARDALFILTVGIVGGSLDSLLGFGGILLFHGGRIAPPWLFGLWMVFATTVFYSLNWLQQRYLLLALLGAAGGALSYYAGHRFGALQLAEPTWGSAALIGAVWAAVTPAIFGFSRCLTARGGACRVRARRVNERL